MTTLLATFESRRSGSNMVRLNGVLDEHTDFDALLQAAKPGVLVVHLGGVTHFTEAGTRAWVAWLANLDARGVKADLVACSPQLVEAFNCDAQLARCARVKSVQAVYRCAKCNRDDVCVVTIAEIQQADGAPQRACQTCIGRLAMVEEPSRYFEFAAQLPRRNSTASDLSLKLATGSVADIARGSRASLGTNHTQPMLRLRPSAWSTVQKVMAKNAVRRPMTSDRNYIIGIVVVLVAILGGIAALMLTL